MIGIVVRYIPWGGDSFDVDKGEGESVKEFALDRAVKVYMGGFHDFSEGESIYNIVEKAESFECQSAFLLSTEWLFNGQYDPSNLYKYAVFSEMVFGHLVDVYKVYCFRSGSRDGYFIYYVTSVGDYVLYANYWMADFNLYLFKADEFCDYAKKVTLYRNEMANDNTDGMKYGIWFPECDLTPYIFRPTLAFVGRQLLIIAITLIVGLAYNGYVKKKRKSDAVDNANLK